LIVPAGPTSKPLELDLGAVDVEGDRLARVLLTRSAKLDTDPKELDDWYEFVKRAAVPELMISGKLTIIGRDRPAWCRSPNRAL
jgi:hypothetical protein